jgi:hypothetical protein
MTDKKFQPDPVVPRRRRRRRAPPVPNAFAFTIADAQAMGAPGRTKIYALLGKGVLKRLRIAGRTMIEGDSLRALLRG